MNRSRKGMLALQVHSRWRLSGWLCTALGPLLWFGCASVFLCLPRLRCRENVAHPNTIQNGGGTAGNEERWGGKGGKGMLIELNRADPNQDKTKHTEESKTSKEIQRKGKEVNAENIAPLAHVRRPFLPLLAFCFTTANPSCPSTTHATYERRGNDGIRRGRCHHTHRCQIGTWSKYKGGMQ